MLSPLRSSRMLSVASAGRLSSLPRINVCWRLDVIEDRCVSILPSSRRRDNGTDLLSPQATRDQDRALYQPGVTVIGRQAIPLMVSSSLSLRRVSTDAVCSGLTRTRFYCETTLRSYPGLRLARSRKEVTVGSRLFWDGEYSSGFSRECLTNHSEQPTE
jgi:hypothetical protein